jgi:hypothetical protein
VSGQSICRRGNTNRPALSRRAVGSAPIALSVFASCCKPSCLKNRKTRRSAMLETIAVVLVLLWLLGLVTSTTMGGLIHILLVIAIVVILIRLIQGRRVV